MSLFLAPGIEAWIKYLEGVSKTSTAGMNEPSALAAERVLVVGKGLMTLLLLKR